MYQKKDFLKPLILSLKMSQTITERIAAKIQATGAVIAARQLTR